MQSKITPIPSRPTNDQVASSVRQAAEAIDEGLKLLVCEVERHLHEASKIGETLEGLTRLDPALGSLVAELKAGLIKADMGIAAWNKRKNR